MLQLYYEDDDDIECGIDEAGAGCLAGRLFTACVILPKKIDPDMDPDNLCEKIKDSKKLSKKLRTKLFDFITNKLAIDYSIVYIEPEEIDEGPVTTLPEEPEEAIAPVTIQIIFDEEAGEVTLEE